MDVSRNIAVFDEFRTKYVGIDLALKALCYVLRLRSLYTPDDSTKQHLQSIITSILDARMLCNGGKHFGTFYQGLKAWSASGTQNTFLALRILSLCSYMFRTLEQIFSDLGYLQRNFFTEWDRGVFSLNYKKWKSLGLVCCAIIEVTKLYKFRKSVKKYQYPCAKVMSPNSPAKLSSVGAAAGATEEASPTDSLYAPPTQSHTFNLPGVPRPQTASPPLPNFLNVQTPVTNYNSKFPSAFASRRGSTTAKQEPGDGGDVTPPLRCCTASPDEVSPVGKTRSLPLSSVQASTTIPFSDPCLDWEVTSDEEKDRKRKLAEAKKSFRRSCTFLIRNICDMIVYFQWISWYRQYPTVEYFCGMTSGVLGAALVWEDASLETKRKL